MHMLLNKWRLDSSLNALVHVETGEIQRLGEFHYILLETLVSHAGDVLSRNFLINTVWKNRVVGNNSLPTAIYALRAALGDDGRLQEIIKTVPKKGYVFNKDFITYTDVTATAETVRQEENSAFAAALCPEQPEQPEPPVKERQAVIKSKKTIFISIIVIIALVFVVKSYSHLVHINQTIKTLSAHTGLIVKEETTKDYSRIRIYHLHSGNDPGHEAQLAKHMPDALSSINRMLQAKQMTAVFYYSESVAKLSISFIVQDNCHNQYQLMLGIQNWQNSVKDLNDVVYQATEKTINEIPACN